MRDYDTDVAVIGAGPAGLAAALTLRRLGRRVLVIEREREAGVPRHCHHTGFGWFDLRRLLSGPAYARLRTESARDAGAEILTNTTLLGPGPAGLLAAGPDGLANIRTRATILATGCRERPRTARLVPGDRPAGVFTTGSLQQLVYLKRVPIGRRAVVIGAEHVSYSAVQTLWHGGAQVAALVTTLPGSQTYWPVRAYFSGLRGVRLLTGAKVTGIFGGARVERVELETTSGGAGSHVTSVPCDTVVFTGDWIPDHELACRLGVTLDPGTRGPAVDGDLRTEVHGVFAAGNGVHAAEMADVAALGGVAAAQGAHRFLAGSADAPWPKAVPLEARAPLAWICPNRLTPGTPPPLGRYVFRSAAFAKHAVVTVSQGDKVIASHPVGHLVPNRSLHFPAGFEPRVATDGGPVTIALA